MRGDSRGTIGGQADRPAREWRTALVPDNSNVPSKVPDPFAEIFGQPSWDDIAQALRSILANDDHADPSRLHLLLADPTASVWPIYFNPLARHR